MSQALKLGYGIDKMVHAWLLETAGLGMLMDAQVCWCNSTVHVQGFSHWKREADDHDVIR